MCSGKISGHRGGELLNPIARVISCNFDFWTFIQHAIFEMEINKGVEKL